MLFGIFSILFSISMFSTSSGVDSKFYVIFIQQCFIVVFTLFVVAKYY